VHHQGIGGDDYGCRVGRGVAHDALEPRRHGQQIRQLGVVLHLLAQLGRLGDGLLDVAVLDHLRDAIHIGQRHPKGPPHIAHRRTAGHGAECAHLGDSIGAVLACDVLDDLAAPIVGEVQVDVGRVVALGVQEALEVEAHPEGVQVVDL